MNPIKGSIIYKTLIHIMLFLSGLILFLSAVHVITYLDSYSTTIHSVTETPLFQSRYLKYVERLAIYIHYRENGYVSTSNGDYSERDLESLFETETKLVETTITKEDKQEEFNYYNSVLNISNWTFQYYVKNLDTGVIYSSKALEPMVKELQEERDQELTLNSYLKTAQKNEAYLILNTDTKKYVTNVNRNFQYLNEENLGWVIDYITGNITKSLSDEDETSYNYIICTTIAENEIPAADGYTSEYVDEFGFMFQHFKKANERYKSSILIFPVALISLLLFLILAVISAGYKKGVPDIVLNAFDRIKIELGSILSLSTLLGVWLFATKVWDFLEYQFYLDIFIIYIVLYTLLYPFCAFILFGLIRRMKANILFTNSFFYIGMIKIRKGMAAFFSQHALTYPLTALLLIFAAIEVVAYYLYVNPLFYMGEFLLLGAFGFAFLGYHLYRAAINFSIITKDTKGLTEGNITHKIDTSEMCTPAKTLGEYINNIGDGLSAAVDEKLKSERLKTELIANVSHDIKTPLTSIINYVDLLKKENLENEKAISYLEILTTKSWRLKTLIEDLVEASKASSGTISLNLECLNLVELVRQSLGEFEDRFTSHNLEAVLNITEEPVYILADGRNTYRIIENIFSNANKYALSGTRIYVDITASETLVIVSVKNISAAKLNINGDELMERFVRGDLSRNTEGSGLGLSIAKSLASLQDATFDIILDGDLFKAVVKFKRLMNPPSGQE